MAALALAGCVEGQAGGASPQGEPARPAPEPVVGSDTGAIRGTVTDEALSPVPNAQALVREAGATAVSDAGGVFTISGLPAGSYQLFVAALGYDSVARRVDVAAGEVTEVTVQLSAIPVAEPYRELFIFRGFFGCSWYVVIARGPCFFPGPDVNPYVFPQQNRAFFYNIWPNWRTTYGELYWQQTSLATGTTLTMTLSYANRTTSHWWSSVESRPPLIQYCERDAEDWIGCNGGNQLPSAEPQEIPEEGIYIRQFVNTGSAEVAGNRVPFFGMAFQQPIELYTSNFYWEPMPEGYSAIEDQ